jgi:molybdopterin-guanine dinucleotide biosynthesis protein B
MNIPVLSVIGRKNTGKTWTVETLTSLLTERGRRVGVIKHIHHRGWTMDKKGKDTWKHARAGARIVMAVSPEEMGIVRKLDTADFGLEDMLRYTQQDDLDLVLLEGFHMITSDRSDVYKIVTAKDEKQLLETMQDTSPPIIAIAGVIGAKTSELDSEIPIVDLLSEGMALADIVEERLFNARKAGKGE